MQQINLKINKREVSGKAVKDLRVQGIVPGVVYGQGKEAISVQVDERTLEKAYHTAGTSRLVEVEIEGGESKTVLFHEVQHDPITRKITHFDLYTVRMDQAIRTEVPLHWEGEAPAVHALNALLLRPLEAIEIEALPKDLPENIVVDLTVLAEIDQSIHVRDLKIPEGVTVLQDPEDLIVKVEEQREEEVFEELPEEGAEAELVEAEHGAETESGEAEAEGKEAEASEGKEGETK